MNTAAQTTVSLTTDQVRERLTQLARRAFKTAVDDVELELLVAVTTGETTTFTLPGNVWGAVLRHHGDADYPFDETDNNETLQHYYAEAWQVFHRLATTAEGEKIDDEFVLYPDMDDTLTTHTSFVSLVERGGEIVNYACSLPGYLADGKVVADALGDDGTRTMRHYFAGQWLYHPADLGVALVEHGFGRDVRTLRGLSLALIGAVEAHNNAESDAEQSAQLDVIDLLWPLLKGIVFASIKVPNSPAVAISENDGTFELVEKALSEGLNMTREEGRRFIFRLAEDDDARAALSTPTYNVLEAFRDRIRREADVRGGIWD